MTEPSEDQKLANERTDHLGRPKQNGPEVPKESFEQGETGRVERQAPQRRGEEDVERA